MERQLVFQILGIADTDNQEAIKRAYLEQLKDVNPEDNPEGFKRLRTAYETAIQLANEQDEGEEEKDEIDLWIDRVDEVYQNIICRRDIGCWKELCSDSVCTDLETALEALNRLLTYLMSHTYLPLKIWAFLNETFGIAENKEELSQQFPQDFLNFVIFRIENDSFLDYDLFRETAGNKENINADAYIRTYMEINSLANDNKFDEAEEKWQELSAFGIYHPYEDVERVRLFLHKENLEEARVLSEKLTDSYPEDIYVLVNAAAVKWELDKQEEAFELWNQVLKIYPKSYKAKIGVAQYYLYKQNYSEAKELALAILDDSEDENALQIMQSANEELIKGYKERLEESPGDGESIVELGWCFYQNRKIDEAVGLLEAFTPGSDQEYSYHNLLGRIYYSGNQEEKALPHLEIWLKLLKKMEAEPTPENQKQLRRLGLANYMLGWCHKGLKNLDEAVQYIEEAVKTAENPSEQLSYKTYLAQIYLDKGEFEKAVDVCDSIIEEEDDYYPAYLNRQEACYKLRNAQQVVDDYYRAIEIFPGFYKPYLLAAKVFYNYSQYEDAKGVIDRAKENEVEFSDQMHLYEVKILRFLAESNEEREQALEICYKLLEDAASNEDTDIENLSEIEFELSMLYWDNDNFEKAKEHIKSAMKEEPEEKSFIMYLGDICRTNKEYQEALEQYHLAKEYYDDTPRYHYNMGRCYEALLEREKAREEYEKVIKLDESYADINLRMADYYKEEFRQKKKEALIDLAISYMDKQIEKTDDCYYRVHRARMYMDKSDLDTAIAEHEKALEFDPKDWACYNNIGYCLKIKGECKKAIEMFEKALECMDEESKSVLPYSNMADCYEIQDDYEHAIECYKKVLEMFPDRYAFWEEIGDLYTYLEEYDKALEAYKEVEQDPDYDMGLKKTIGDVYWKMGMKDKAMAYYADSIKKRPGNRAEGWNELGFVYMERLGDYKKALKCFQIAVKLAQVEECSDLKEYEDSLAQFYYMTGNLEKSREYAKKALEKFLEGYDSEEEYAGYKAYGPARYGVLGRLYLYMGHKEKGLSYLERMHEGLKCRSCRHHECYEEFLYKGRCYEAENDYKEALECYEKALSISPFNTSAAMGIKRMKEAIS